MSKIAAAQPIQAVVASCIAATNAFDIKTALALFSTTAVIDDSSTGHRFIRHAGVRDYLQRYFLGYHTVTRLLSLDRLDAMRALARVDFTGDFGHEIGLLLVAVNPTGHISHIDAELE
jgi:hypothetical protein